MHFQKIDALSKERAIMLYYIYIYIFTAECVLSNKCIVSEIPNVMNLDLNRVSQDKTLMFVCYVRIMITTL